MPSKYDDLELHDLMTEEKTRGTRHPRKAVSVSQKRELVKIGRMILNRNCTKREYLQAIRDYGPKDGSSEFQRLVSLWDEYHGRI
ncbi:MAG TPA: hypothetical protein VKM93_25480 [Terriglobia bacterium]|nr:hypothetical protein [Terriglobia bacterium]